MKSHSPGTRAFIQLELLLSGLLGCLLLGVFLAGLLTLLRGMLPSRVHMEGRVYAVAPCYAPFASSLRVQKQLHTWFSQASAIYVLGSLDLDPSAAAGTGALSLDELPSLRLAPGELPLSGDAFARRFGSVLGAQTEPGEPGTFSLLVFAPEASELNCACLVQVRRKQSPDTRWFSYSVSYRDRTGLRLDYAFVEPASSGSRLQSSAMRSWHRKPRANFSGEEAAVSMVLPDPWRFGGDQLGELGGLSRFAQVLTHSP